MVVFVVPAGIAATRVAAPVIANLVRTYGPRILDAAAGTGIGAFIGDKLFNLSDDVKTGSDLEAESKEEREAKKEKRTRLLIVESLNFNLLDVQNAKRHGDIIQCLKEKFLLESSLENEYQWRKKNAQKN